MDCCGPIEDTLDFIDHCIEEVGWEITHVGDTCIVSWAFTIGLLGGFDHPELVVVGLTPRSSSAFLNAVGTEVKQGRRFLPGETHEFGGQYVRFGRVDPEHWETDRFAIWHTYYEDRGGRPPIPIAIQVLWDDPDGRFPDDPGFDPRFDRLHVDLSRPPGADDFARHSFWPDEHA